VAVAVELEPLRRLFQGRAVAGGADADLVFVLVCLHAATTLVAVIVRLVALILGPLIALALGPFVTLGLGALLLVLDVRRGLGLLFLVLGVRLGLGLLVLDVRLALRLLVVLVALEILVLGAELGLVAEPVVVG
jgi:hypothetical protein